MVSGSRSTWTSATLRAYIAKPPKQNPIRPNASVIVQIIDQPDQCRFARSFQYYVAKFPFHITRLIHD